MINYDLIIKVWKKS